MASDSTFRVPNEPVVPVVLLLIFAATLVSPSVIRAADSSVADYLASLERVESVVRSADETPGAVRQLLADLPAAWTVIAGDRSIVISSDWLRDDLKEFDALESAAVRDRLLSRLRLAREDATGFLRQPADASSTRIALDTVLARREFRGIGGPTWRDRLQQRVLRFLERFAAFHASAFPTLANLLIYGLVGLAAGMAGIWFFRSIKRHDPVRPRLGLEGIEGAQHRGWSEWLALARAEAAQRQWRDAIRLAYWCGIVFLEAKGEWRPDPSRTPREYVSALASSSQHGPALQALTRLLERIWYGRAPADAQAFDEALAHLASLGCPTP